MCPEAWASWAQQDAADLGSCTEVRVLTAACGVKVDLYRLRDMEEFWKAGLITVIY